jgi:hypothetical protein
MTTELAATSSSVAPDVVHSYREHGYVHVPQVLSPEEVTAYREAGGVRDPAGLQRGG